MCSLLARSEKQFREISAGNCQRGRAEHGPIQQEPFPPQDSSGTARKVQVLRNFALAWRDLSLPAGNSSVLPVQLCGACKNSESAEWEEHAERRERQKQLAVCCCLCRVEAEATAALHAKADPSNCYCRLIFQNTITTSLPTLFKACTGMWEASMSFRSLSASYLRSLETLNLQSKMWVWLSAEETVGARTVINSSD